MCSCKSSIFFVFRVHLSSYIINLSFLFQHTHSQANCNINDINYKYVTIKTDGWRSQIRTSRAPVRTKNLIFIQISSYFELRKWEIAAKFTRFFWGILHLKNSLFKGFIWLLSNIKCFTGHVRVLQTRFKGVVLQW